MLIVRSENDNGLLLALAYSDVAVVLSKARYRRMTVCEQLIKERLTDLRKFFEFIQFNDRNDPGRSKMVVSLEDFSQIQELSSIA